MQTIVEEAFERNGKTIGKENLDLLLKKRSSPNPLWLTVACDELISIGENFVEEVDGNSLEGFVLYSLYRVHF